MFVNGKTMGQSCTLAFPGFTSCPSCRLTDDCDLYIGTHAVIGHRVDRAGAAAYGCYLSAGFKEVTLPETEYYRIGGESWKCIEMEYEGKFQSDIVPLARLYRNLRFR